MQLCTQEAYKLAGNAKKKKDFTVSKWVKASFLGGLENQNSFFS